MNTELENLNQLRDAVITRHFDAAMAELKEAITNDPLREKFYVYSGCVNKEISDQICTRFNKIESINANVHRTFIIGTYYLDITVPRRSI